MAEKLLDNAEQEQAPSNDATARAVEREAIGSSLRERLVELEEANVRIQNFSEELSMRVEEATADLAQKVTELAEAKEQVEEAQRSQAEFIAMIAHELGQPVTTLMGFAQLLARDNLPKDVVEDARATFLAETRRLRRLVRDLSDVSSLIGGHFSIHIAPNEIVDVIQEQVKAMQATTEKHTIRLDVQTDPLLVINCDADRIAQLLSNLLSNAIKYTSAGEIQVTVRSSETHLIITVSDEGPGIHPEYADTIFEPYFRAPHASSQKSRGMGLGLYITRAIAEAHRGKIELMTTKSLGATFEITLPLGIPLEEGTKVMTSAS